LHNELHNLYSSRKITWAKKSRRVRWAGHVAHIEDMRNAYKVVFGKHEGKRPLGRFKLKRDNTHTHTHTHTHTIHTYIHSMDP